jgi:endonuclease/exonuclease/phosphatase family metal-dependent hydrolase
MGTSEAKSTFRGLMVLVTLLLALSAIIASYAGYQHPSGSAFLPTLGLLMPGLLIANVAAALMWLLFTRRKYWLLVPLLAFAFNHNYLSAIFRLHPRPEVPVAANADGYLKVFTYNVQHFGNEITGFSARELAAYLKKENADILCFQEFNDNKYFPLDSLREVFAHWEHVMLPQGDSLSGILPLAVFSRYPIVNSQFIRFDGSSNSSLYCDVQLPDDTVRIINNHLQTTNVSQNRRRLERGLDDRNNRKRGRLLKEFVSGLHANEIKRAAQTDRICELIQTSPHPVVVCGDFNSLPSSYTYRRITNLLTDGFRSAGRGYMYTFRYFKHLLRIDYIFHSPGMEGIRYDSPDMDLCSDHNPVMMLLKYLPLSKP